MSGPVRRFAQRAKPLITVNDGLVGSGRLNVRHNQLIVINVNLRLSAVPIPAQVMLLH